MNDPKIEAAKEAPMHQITATTKVVVTIPGDEAQGIPFATARATLGEYLFDNRKSVGREDEEEIISALGAGKIYVGGQADGVQWTIRLDAPTPPGALPIPRKPEDDDWSPMERLGFEAFARMEALDIRMAHPDWLSGWQTGWTRCYGQGVKAAARDEALDACDRPGEAENPYPQFSAAWEAWAAGFDDFEVL